MAELDIVVDSLGDLNFSPMPTVDSLKAMVEGNLPEFSKLVSSLTKRLGALSDIDEYVNSIESEADQSTFALETCAFLKELSCPYRVLLEGPVDERFKTPENRLKLLEFLTSEMQTAYMLAADRPKPIEEALRGSKQDESEEAKALRRILMTLGFAKPPANTTVNEIWTKIESKCNELLSKLPQDYLGKPLLTQDLNEKQWLDLAHINQTLCDDYQMRRELLLTRLDVTVQSFKWADRLKKSNSEISSIYQQRRKELSVRQNIKPYYILAARDDLCKQERTCSTRLMTKSKLHKVIIPKVPDRGGRTCELQPPPPDMPAFQKRKAQPQRQQGGDRGGGRGGGGHHQRFDNSNKWAQSDFERFQDQNYSGGNGGGYGGHGGHGGHGGGGGGGGGYRGGRGGGRGGRGGHNRY